MKRIKTIFLSVFAVLVLTSSAPQIVPSPQNLMVTLSGFRDDNKQLKCRLYYMTTLPTEDISIKKARVKLFKPTGGSEFQEISNIIVPLDWDAAKKTEGVVSFYTAKNILYIGIGEFDLLRKYKCSIAFIDGQGKESKAAIYSKL